MDEKSISGERINLVPVVLTALLSTCFTLIALLPVGFIMWQQMPPQLATIDLQKIVEENQAQLIDFLGVAGGTVSDDKRASGQKMTADFAQRLTKNVAQLSTECHCILINKAALLSGTTPDYTDLLRERMETGKSQ